MIFLSTDPPTFCEHFSNCKLNIMFPSWHDYVFKQSGSLYNGRDGLVAWHVDVVYYVAMVI